MQYKGEIQPKYPQQSLLPKFKNHLSPPDESYNLLGQITDELNYKRTTYFFSHNNKLLVILDARSKNPDDPRYNCGQFEAPLEFLSWFPKALEEYLTPSSQGGLHPGAMTSADENVGGEMMCVQRAMDAGNNQQGYFSVNRSRPDRISKDRGYYRASEICFAENFLYEGGLLDLIKSLGEKFEAGTL